MQVLVVEDEALSAIMIEDALSDAGHIVRGPASTPSRALALAELAPPDIALININHHGCGRQAADLARELLQRWGTPSLFVSGRTSNAREHSDAALGVVGKPYDSETIVACIEIAALVKAGKHVPRTLIPDGLELFG